eukprot:1159951-Pelagomonas_calceolata.AAC.6
MFQRLQIILEQVPCTPHPYRLKSARPKKKARKLSPHLDISTHALLTTGDQVVAVVQLVIGVAENGGIARQRPLGVEAYTIEVGIVGTSLHERARAHSLLVCLSGVLGVSP